MVVERSRLNTEGKKKRYTSRQFWYDNTPGGERKKVVEISTPHREKSSEQS